MDSPKPPRKAPLGPALRTLVARARQGLTSHPDADELIAYHERRLGEPEAERLRDHLAACTECAGLLLELAAFSEAEPAEPAGLTDRQVEDAWRGFASRLAAAHARDAGDAGEHRPPPRRRSIRPLPWAIAAALAALLVAVLALSAWVIGLRQELRSRSRPRADAVLANLEPRGDSTRGAAGDVAERPRADRPATLILHAPAGRAYRRYEIRLREARPGGQVLWRASGLEPRDLGLFVVELPASALPPGTYRLELYGLAADRREPLADYDLTLAGTGPGSGGLPPAATTQD